MLGKERVHLAAKGFVPLAQYSDGLSAQARAPFETLANGIFEVLVVALMDEGGFRGLDGCEDFDGLCPPCNIDLDSGQAERFKLRPALAQACNDCGFAIVKERLVHHGKSFRRSCADSACVAKY